MAIYGQGGSPGGAGARDGLTPFLMPGPATQIELNPASMPGKEKLGPQAPVSDTHQSAAVTPLACIWAVTAVVHSFFESL